MNDAVVIQSGVTLTRNYPDIPFDTSGDPEAAALVISRTAEALESSDFVLQLLRGMSENDRLVLMERALANKALLQAARTSAALLPLEGSAGVMMGGSDHVLIACNQPGLALSLAAEACFSVEDRLSRRVNFAYDEALGYLTAHPSLTGTGMRASIRMHVPMIIRARQEGGIASAVRAQGIRLYALGMADEKPEGNVLEIANIGALGRTEQEICQALTAEANKICQMEAELRSRELQEHPVALEDRVFRALGTLRSARLLSEAEFWRLWSDVRLGAAMELLPLSVGQVDALMNEVKPAHLRSYAEEALTGEALDACRASRVRELLEEPTELL